MPLDPMKLQVFNNYTLAVVESMANALHRTAHSVFVKETEDFTIGLVTPEGLTYIAPRSLGVSWFVGLDYGAAISMVDSYEEGDIVITNDPYSGAVCTHTPDMHIWKPIFHNGELVSFAVAHIHNTDMGGAVPASLSRSLTEVHQEGIRFRPTKLFKKGKLNQELVDIMLTNVRSPEQNWGDLKAMIAAVNTGETKLKNVLEKYTTEQFRAGMYGLLDYSERQVRSLIRTIPNGRFRFCDYMDEDSPNGLPCRLSGEMIINDEDIVFDFSKSDPQVRSALNVPTGGNPRHALLMVGMFFAMYTIRRGIDLNCGTARAFTSVLPEGSILNPLYPAAVGLRTLTATRLQDVIFGCLAQAIPDGMAAAHAGGASILNIRTTDRRTGRVLMAALAPVVGGGGGMPFSDGSNGAGGNTGSLRNTPIEISEAEVPVHITRYHLVCDSGGAGTYRGGLASLFEFKISAPGTVITARNRDRCRFQPWGLKGGRAGKPSSYAVNVGKASEIVLGNTDVYHANPRDTLTLISAGAGGYGSPIERDASSVLTDVRRGFVSVEGAARDYGVVITDGQVDSDATNRTRREYLSAENGELFAFGEGRERFEHVWTIERYDRLIDTLYEFPVEWRFFLKHRVFAEYTKADPRDIREFTTQIAEEEGIRPKIKDAISA